MKQSKSEFVGSRGTRSRADAQHDDDGLIVTQKRRSVLRPLLIATCALTACAAITVPLFNSKSARSISIDDAHRILQSGENQQARSAAVIRLADTVFDAIGDLRAAAQRNDDSGAFARTYLSRLQKECSK